MARRKTWQRKRKEIEKDIAKHYDGPPPWEVQGISSEQWAKEGLANMEARSGPPPWEVEEKSVEQWAREQKEREEELARPLQNERGRFLDAITQIDWSLADLIADHFGVARDRVTEFVEWMAFGFNFAEKADIISVIVESRELEGNFGSLSAGLRRANQLRNILAHAILEPGPEDSSIFLMRSRGGLSFYKYTLDELRTYVQRAYALNYNVMHLHGVITGEWSDNFKNPYEGAGDF
jgi:hypothetical protein